MDRDNFFNFLRNGGQIEARIIGQVLAGRNDPRTVVADPGARYFGAILDDNSLVPGKGAQLGEVTLEEFESTGKGVRQ